MPDIDGTDVVWLTYDHTYYYGGLRTVYSIWYHNIVTRTTEQLPIGTIAFGGVSNGRVFYNGVDGGRTSNAIQALDLKTRVSQNVLVGDGNCRYEVEDARGNLLLYRKLPEPGAVCFGTGLGVYDLAVGTHQLIPTIEPDHFQLSPRVSGKLVAWSDYDLQQVVVHDLRTGLSRALGVRAGAPSVSGARVAWFERNAVTNQSDVIVYDTDRDVVERIQEGVDGGHLHPAIDGSRVVFSREPHLYSYNLETRILEPVTNPVTGFRFRDQLAVSGHRVVWTEETGDAADPRNGIYLSELPLPDPATLIATLTDAPDPFSPNGDGIDEVSRIGATFNGTITAGKLLIRDAAGQLVRAYGYTGSRTVLQQDWDGKNGSGVRVPDGTYTYTLIAVDAAKRGTERSGTAVVATPDLTVSDLRIYPEQPTTGAPIEVTAVISNPTTAWAGASQLRLRVGGESNPPVYAVRPIPPGTGWSVRRSVTLSKVQRYQVTATADSAGQVAESNEANNVRYIVFSVGP